MQIKGFCQTESEKGKSYEFFNTINTKICVFYGSTFSAWSGYALLFLMVRTSDLRK